MRVSKLDLHGYNLKQALKKFDDFINSLPPNCKKARIITGRGNHSINGPVLFPNIGKRILNHPRIRYRFTLYGNGGYTIILYRNPI